MVLIVNDCSIEKQGGNIPSQDVDDDDDFDLLDLLKPLEDEVEELAPEEEEQDVLVTVVPPVVRETSSSERGGSSEGANSDADIRSVPSGLAREVNSWRAHESVAPPFRDAHVSELVPSSVISTADEPSSTISKHLADSKDQSRKRRGAIESWIEEQNQLLMQDQKAFQQVLRQQHHCMQKQIEQEQEEKLEQQKQEYQQQQQLHRLQLVQLRQLHQQQMQQQQKLHDMQQLQQQELLRMQTQQRMHRQQFWQRQRIRQQMQINAQDMETETGDEDMESMLTKPWKEEQPGHQTQGTSLAPKGLQDSSHEQAQDIQQQGPQQLQKKEQQQRMQWRQKQQQQQGKPHQQQLKQPQQQQQRPPPPCIKQEVDECKGLEQDLGPMQLTSQHLQYPKWPQLGDDTQQQQQQHSGQRQARAPLNSDVENEDQVEMEDPQPEVEALGNCKDAAAAAQGQGKFLQDLYESTSFSTELGADDSPESTTPVPFRAHESTAAWLKEMEDMMPASIQSECVEMKDHGTSTPLGECSLVFREVCLATVQD
eukprot:TRINITY_DN14884_c1_g1_i5.p1 TRINITY_DN14884_c1_g1~~TRINITY_DN14884_c1_g1_i5.p1  ORF type:complete len:538 (+),score=193.23 TRINITY_DN14884_c1_g1_i5:80-1693(+)